MGCTQRAAHQLFRLLCQIGSRESLIWGFETSSILVEGVLESMAGYYSVELSQDTAWKTRGGEWVATQAGERFIPAFTSQSELKKWPFPMGGAGNVTFTMLSGIVVDDDSLSGIVVNPFHIFWCKTLQRLGDNRIFNLVFLNQPLVAGFI
jgi:hypothetical protein